MAITDNAVPSAERAPRFAIIGYAARLPGAADADQYWDVLRDGRDAVSEIPADRWDADDFFDSDAAAAGKVVTRRAGFVDDVSGFDAPFFGVSAREARLMDPQHRLLLETSWRAVEHSGTAPTALANTRTGVFVGLSTHDYLGMASSELTYPEIEAYLAIGTSGAAGAGRISYRLGLHGPAVTVDTACSSSLVAIHQACQALQLDECDLALAGGANALLSPATMITFSQSRMLAPDGKCKTFDAAADGYVRGEGCGVIVIKRLEDAVRDGDRIRAVIRGSAVNQDGASGGLTVPNGVAQQRVITEALDRAGLAPNEVDYLEAHGTGTSLGDPIEVQAAAAALGKGRDADRPLLIGSAKTNIGHLEAAAGVAGVLKVVLALEHQELPKHLNFRNPSPHIPWERIPVRVVDGGDRRGRRQRQSPDRRCQLVRVLRHQRPRHPRRTTGAGGPGGARRGARLPAVHGAPAVGAHPGRPGGDRGALPQLADRAPRRRPDRGGPDRRRRPGPSRAPGRTGGELAGLRTRTARRARR